MYLKIFGKGGRDDSLWIPLLCETDIRFAEWFSSLFFYVIGHQLNISYTDKLNIKHYVISIFSNEDQVKPIYLILTP